MLFLGLGTKVPEPPVDGVLVARQPGELGHAPQPLLEGLFGFSCGFLCQASAKVASALASSPSRRAARGLSLASLRSSRGILSALAKETVALALDCLSLIPARAQLVEGPAVRNVVGGRERLPVGVPFHREIVELDAAKTGWRAHTSTLETLGCQIR